MWVDCSHRRSTIAAEGGIRAAGATDPPVNDASEKEKEGCGLGPMMERSSVFSAGETGPLGVNANIVEDELYKAMNPSASSSSPVQDDAVLNLDRDASLVGLMKWQSFTKDRDLEYFVSQDLEDLEAEYDLITRPIYYDNPHASQSIHSVFPDSAELLPAKGTISNVGSTSNPPQLYRGEGAKEMPNNSSLTEYSSVSKRYGDEMVSSENWVETSSAATVNISEGNHEVKSHEPQLNMVSSENWVETSSAATVNISEGNQEVKSHEPQLNMTFPGEEEAQQHYEEYAKIMGFKVRRGKGQMSSDGSLKKKTFLCTKEGKRSNKAPPEMKKYTRKETRTGCKAMIQFSIENGKWVICQFKSEHNHDLQCSTQKHDIDSCSKIPEADSLIQPIHEIGTVREAEPGASARFCNMNYSKHLSTKKMNNLQPEDAQGLLDYFKKLNAEDPSLFYTLQVDAESRITNFFWRDGISKIDYDYFSDVLILDTTFRTTDRYNMICAPFWGLNHHKQQVLFGCAFLLDESLESFAWLLGTFIEAMGRRQPKTIFTTECSEISEAVKAILPKSHHRLCKQLVCQNAKQHLARYYEQPEFESRFHSCLFDCQSDLEFHSIWNSLLKLYDLHGNPWLQNIYVLRTKRPYLFSKVICCAGIHSNQGSENFSHADVFQNMESQAMTLPKYVQKYEKVAEQLRSEELHENFYCSGRKPKLISRSPMEQQAANVYTPTMFGIFQGEFIGSLSAPFESTKKMGSTDTFKVTFVTEGQKTESTVEFNSQDSTISCSCKMFESIGILCVHALRILNTRSQNIFEIPPRYILKRWTRFAKDGVVEDDNGEEIADNSDGPSSLCKRKLVHKAFKVITKSVAVEGTRKIAEHHLDIWLKEVDDVLKKGKEHLNTNYEGFSNTSRVAHVEKKEKVVKYFNQEETSKRRMEPQIQKKRKNEARAMDPLSSMSLPRE